MADYWKSQPKKFCQYCKCWIADNKPSIEFHERGKNHKENVAAKISEIKKKSIDKAKQEDRMSKEFAAMEEAAMKAYQEDLKRIEAESARAEAESTKPAVTTEAPSSTGADTWLEGVSDEGHTYYYNTVTGESQWEKPKGYQGKKQKPAKPRQGNEKSQSGHWMEAQSPEGYTYYYNTETGESSWEKPEQYCSPEGTSEGREATEQKDLDTPTPEQASSDSPAPAQEPESSRILPVSKISFRKRKLEKPGESEEEEKAHDGENDGEEERADDGKDNGNDEVEDVGEKSASSDDGETEGKKEEKDGEEETGKEEVAVKRPRNTNPYGAWEQIQAEPDPYENVDLQLPHVEDSGTTPAPSDLPPEPKVKFKERTITSLGDESGAGAVFRRRKAENGKSRSLRQRAEDS